MTSTHTSRHFGRYRTEKLLGEGAMGRVWLAYDENLERNVAIKEPRIDMIASETERSSFCERFMQEARSAARLNHPNIVTIYAVGVYRRHTSYYYGVY